MRVAVISDVHANLHALEAVLAAIEPERPDAVWCLGDTVGYGPQPSRCCTLVEELADLSLCGNHDLGALGQLPLDDFQPDAAEVARWTGTVLDAGSRRWLESLEPEALMDGAALYHASPRDAVWEYVLTPDAVEDALERAPRPIVLVGHSHVALAITRANNGLEGGLVPDGTVLDLDTGSPWLLNPGSVGQPRDGDPRAAWLLLDLDRSEAGFHRVDYPIEQTQREMVDAGLPESLAERLEHGG
jgi:diadenosine tetraphosphatase ApaH/serine/threonine PP2A family protein phosphatase